jgi:hypothetical protein
MPRPYQSEFRDEHSATHRLLIACLFALAVIAVSAVHRYQIDGREYREDEAWWVHAAHHRTLHEQFLWIAGDIHLPVSFVAFGAWISAFGSHEVVARFINTLAICLGMALLFRLAADLFDRWTGLLAVLILGALPLYIFYGNEMRPYGFIVTLTIGAALTYLRWLRRPTFRRALVFVLVGIGTVYTHNFGVLVLVSLYGFTLLVARADWRLHLRAFGLFAAVALSLLGWALPLVHSITVLSPGGSFVGMALHTNYERALLFDWLQMRPAAVGHLLWIVALLVPVGAALPHLRRLPRSSRFRWGQDWRRAYPLLIALGILGLALAINPFLRIITPRNLIVLLPPAALLAAYGARALPWQAGIGVVALLFIPAATDFRIYQETGTYLDAVAFMDASDQPDSRVVIDGRGAVATMPLTYYMRERGRYPKPNEAVFNLTGLDDFDLLVMPHYPVNMARAATPDALAAYSAFLEGARQVWYVTLDGHQTSFGAPFRDLLDRDYVIHRARLFEFVNGRRPVYIADYRRIPDDLADMFVIDEAIRLQKWMLLDDVNVTRCQTVTLESWWRSDTPLNDNYAMTLTLADASGVGVARTDDTPAGTLTLQWEANRPYLDVRALTIPCDLPPGEYPLLLGWYDPDSAESLPAALPDGSPLGGLIYLTTLRLSG